jgi:hypothetical protein
MLVDSEVLSAVAFQGSGYGIDLGLHQALDLFLGREA